MSAIAPLWAFFSPGPVEMVILGVVAVLLFGKRLPEVGRSVGRSLLEFRKGMQGIEDEFRSVSTSVNRAAGGKPAGGASTRAANFNPLDDREEATAPKFEPPKFEPPSSPPRESSVTGPAGTSDPATSV